MKRGVGMCGGLMLVIAGAGAALGGCVYTPYPNALRDSEGNEIRLSAIAPILGDPDLSEDQKKDALRELGITDEDLLNVLLSSAQP